MFGLPFNSLRNIKAKREELKKRREFAINQGVENRFIEILDKLSFDYEKKYNLKF